MDSELFITTLATSSVRDHLFSSFAEFPSLAAFLYKEQGIWSQ